MSTEVLNEHEKAAFAYVASKYPGKAFSNVMAVSVYFREVKGVGKSEKAVGQLPQVYPQELKPCPSCKTPMRKFALCPNCALYSEGFVAQWICPRSVGINQKIYTSILVNELPEEERKQTITYASHLTYVGAVIDTACPCEQRGILVTEAEDNAL